MIKLHGYRPVWDLADGSAFVVKVDCYLRMAGLPYTLTAARSVDELRLEPFGMIPYIEEGGRKIGDSDFIIEYLRGKYGDRLADSWLSPSERAIAHSMRRMLEENLYWVLLYLQWMKTGVHKASMAEALRLLQLAEKEGPERQIQHVVRGYLYAKGIGRQSKEELHKLGNADLTSLSAYLGDKPYFTGDYPSILDASAYAILSWVLEMPFPSLIQRHARSLKNLSHYCTRMRRRFYDGVDAAGLGQSRKSATGTVLLPDISRLAGQSRVAWRQIGEDGIGLSGAEAI